MAPIRILLAAMPRLMCDIVQAQLVSEPDMTVVGVARTAEGLVDEVRDSAPDFVLIGADHDRLVRPLFAERPCMRVLAIEPGDADASLYELRPHRVPLGHVSAAEIATTIRDAAHEPRWSGL